MDSRDIYKDYKAYLNKEVTIEGWIKNHRKQKEYGFIEFNDGTYFKPIQVVYDNLLPNFEEVTSFRVGSAIKVIGTLIESPAKGQEFEIKASDIILEGDCPEDYPIQPKQHSKEFLREQAYLRPRTNLFQAAFRVRSLAAMGIHEYFQNKGYVYIHTPLITATDGEGAGEMFQVTTLDLDRLKDQKEVPYEKDFFGKKVFLTVTGQLEAEAMAMAFKKVYTFGPSFRAENSNTKTHASEFWMIEPEIAFCDLNGVMEIEEELLKYVVKYVMDNGKEEMEFFNKYVEVGLLDKLNNLLKSKSVKIKHEDAITLLRESNQKFEYEPKYGEDIAKEHEKFLTNYFNGPVFLTDWPKDIKAFYMKLNDDNKTVAAVDLLVPGAGELMGGSQREEKLDVLLNRMKAMGIEEDNLDWYLNLRKYGGCIHSGFGMGFERLLIYLTGVDNIRDVIPFPRTPYNCEF